MVGYALPEVGTLFVSSGVKGLSSTGKLAKTFNAAKAAKAAKLSKSIKAFKRIGLSDELASLLAGSENYGDWLGDLVTIVGPKHADNLNKIISGAAKRTVVHNPNAKAKAALESAEAYALSADAFTSFGRYVIWLLPQIEEIGKIFRKTSFKDAVKTLDEAAGNNAALKKKIKKYNEDFDKGKLHSGRISEFRLAAAFVKGGWKLPDISHKLPTGEEIDLLLLRADRYVGLETSTTVKMGVDELSRKHKYLLGADGLGDPSNHVGFIAVSQKTFTASQVKALEEGGFIWARIDP